MNEEQKQKPKRFVPYYKLDYRLAWFIAGFTVFYLIDKLIANLNLFM